MEHRIFEHGGFESGDQHGVHIGIQGVTHTFIYSNGMVVARHPTGYGFPPSM